MPNDLFILNSNDKMNKNRHGRRGSSLKQIKIVFLSKTHRSFSSRGLLFNHLDFFSLIFMLHIHDVLEEPVIRDWFYFLFSIFRLVGNVFHPHLLLARGTSTSPCWCRQKLEKKERERKRARERRKEKINFQKKTFFFRC
jgi:hypothetical protein